MALAACLTGIVDAQVRSFPAVPAPLTGIDPVFGGRGVVVDDDGYLWSTSGPALLRFDGVETERFVPRIEELRGADLTTDGIMVSRRGRIWLSTGHGLIAFEPGDESFTQFLPENDDRASGRRVLCAVEDRQDRIWVGTIFGLGLLDEDNGTFSVEPLDRGPIESRVPNASNEPQLDAVSRGIVGPSGQLWLLMPFGLCRFDPETGDSERFLLDGESAPRRRAFTGLEAAGDSHLWVGTRTSLYRWSVEDRRIEAVLDLRTARVSAFATDHSGRLWVGDVDGSIHALSPDGRPIGIARSTTTPHDLFVDRMQRLWAIGPSGLCSVDVRPRAVQVFRFPELDPSVSHMSSVWSEPDGSAWCALYRSGVRHVAADGLTFRALETVDSTPRNAVDIRRTRSGDLWAVIDLQPGRIREDRFDPMPLPEPADRVRLYEDDAGTLLARAYAGGERALLYRFEDEQGTWNEVADAGPIPRGPIAPVPGALWIAGHSNLLLWDPATETVRRLPLERLPRECRRAAPPMAADGAGGVWVLGRDALSHLDLRLGEARVTLTGSDLLPAGDRLRGLVRDRSGRLWLYGGRALTLFEPETGRLRRYGPGDGLPDSILMHRSGHMTADGEIVIAMRDGFLRFDPEVIAAERPPPRVALASCFVADQRLDRGHRDERASLSYRDTLISFDLAALLEPSPDSLEYAFRLVGLADAWQSNGNRRRVSFVNLAGGSYELEARIRRQGERWSDPIGLIEFEITPPFWQTTWFRGAMLMLIAGGLITAYRLRTNAIRRRNAALTSQVRIAEFGRFALESPDIAAVFERGLELALGSCGMSHGEIIDLDGRQRGAIGDGLRTEERVETHELARRALASPTVVAVAEPRLDPRPRRLAETGVVSGVAIAISGADGPFGVLALYHVRPRRVSDRRRALLLAITDILGQTLARRRAEDASQALAEQLEQARRLEAIGRMAGGVSHDFNNILTALMGQSELLLHAIEDDAARADVEQIQLSCERAAELTNQLLAFSRRQVLQPCVFEVGPVLRGLDPMLRRLIREDIELVIEVEDEACFIRADRSQLEQVIVNLVANARDAMPEGGQLSIELARIDDGREGGTWVVLTVRDSGVGMDEATAARIFEPFFTTKGRGQGTGLGLATVHGIVEQSGGYLEVASAVHTGTSIRACFPLVDALPSTTPAEPKADHNSWAGTPTILVCDDYSEITTLSARMLEREGCHVLTANSPEEALRLAREDGQVIDLLLTDVVMPGLNGPQLAAAIRAIHPRVEVLYMSGYVDDVSVGQEGVDRRRLIEKPFSSSVLRSRVADALGSRH